MESSCPEDTKHLDSASHRLGGRSSWAAGTQTISTQFCFGIQWEEYGRGFIHGGPELRSARNLFRSPKMRSERFCAIATCYQREHMDRIRMCIQRLVSDSLSASGYRTTSGKSTAKPIWPPMRGLATYLPPKTPKVKPRPFFSLYIPPSINCTCLRLRSSSLEYPP